MIYSQIAIRNVVSTMTGKQRKFFEAYITDPDSNATRAARIAGYANPEKAGPRAAKSAKIVAAIEEVLHQQTMSRNEVLARLSSQAAAEYSEFIGTDGRIDLIGMKAAGKMHLIKSTRIIPAKHTKEGFQFTDDEIEVTFTDSQTALIWMGKHYAAFTDRTIEENPAQDEIARALAEISKSYPIEL